MESVIHDFGGFYRKVGQICGTAKQMMPDAYLECFSRTMDNNPQVPFRVIKRTARVDDVHTSPVTEAAAAALTRLSDLS